MSFKRILLIVTGCILFFSLISLHFEVIPNRLLRLSTSGIIFLFALNIFSYRNLLGLGIFSLFVLCDLFLLFWEQSFSRPAYYISHIGAIAILTFLTVRELEWPRISKIEYFSIAFFFLINSTILLFLGDYFDSGINDMWLRILFYTNGFLILTLVLSAFLYSINFANDVSAFLFVSVMGLTISDLLLFGIYFIDLQEFRYYDNAFYLVGLMFLLLSYSEHRKISQRKTGERIEGIQEEEKHDNMPGIYR